ncbi:MAG TPA: hypothetical protein VF618_20745 [Thermoanaerobaculia bacterium]
MEFLRLLGAGLFVFGGLLFARWLFAPSFQAPQLAIILMISFAVLLLAAREIFGFYGRRRRPVVPTAEERYVAVRAFGVEANGYYFELQNGQVLYLDDRNLDGFPSTEFVLRRHQTEGYIVDIEVIGGPMPLDAIVPPFADEEDAPNDGDVLVGGSYQNIKNDRTNRTDRTNGTNGTNHGV